MSGDPGSSLKCMCGLGLLPGQGYSLASVSLRSLSGSHLQTIRFGASSCLAGAGAAPQATVHFQVAPLPGQLSAPYIPCIDAMMISSPSSASLEGNVDLKEMGFPSGVLHYFIESKGLISL